jgi:ubiquitin-conjugating enzyme E2 Z
MTSIAHKRIARDVAALAANERLLEAQGIYYHYDDADINRGIAMLVGAPDTPYDGGFYFFEIAFPVDYPFSPLRVRSLTQDGVTRFNPNMYICGKVCLSILGTWHDGPQWSATQTLESVLLALMSAVLNENPLTNEPAYRNAGASTEALVYRRMIAHANAHTAIAAQLRAPPPYAAPFIEKMRDLTTRRNSELQTSLAHAAVAYDGREETLRIFNMQVKYDYASAARAVATAVEAKN